MKIALVTVALNALDEKEKETQRNKKNGIKNILIIIKNMSENKRKNTEKCMTNLKKNVKYVNALTRNIIVQNIRKPKMHLANLEKLEAETN